MTAPDPRAAAPGTDDRELMERIRELDESLRAIRAGGVDGFVIPGGVATSRTARAAADGLREGTLEQMRDAVLAFDLAGHLVYMNPAAERQYGWTSADALGRPRSAIYEEQPDRAVLDPSGASAFGAQLHRLRSGRSIHVESAVSPLLDGEGLVTGTVAVVRDVTDRRRAEDRRDALARLGEALRQAEDARQVGLAAEYAMAVGLGALGGTPGWTSPGPLAAGKREGAAAALRSVVDQAHAEFVRDVADRAQAASERIEAAAALRDSEARLRQANENLEAAIRQRTSELMLAEEALRQAQKMEAVGQLTGGIAHDFNNLLASISGSLQVLRAKLALGSTEGCERYIDMGLGSVKRAASLTQRLLAFARRQTLDSRPTDVNRLIAGMEDLLRRTVGSAVTIGVSPCADLWATKIDASQLENALLNLCINARDAMLPGGGRLTIATANTRVDDPVEGRHGLLPGDYVVLSVADGGTGIPPEAIDRIFDPFFTTKPLGQGTGLGLSMVYGFVRQSGGQVRVASEVGVGTTMHLYLPRHDGRTVEPEAPAQAPAAEGGRGETVLLVEDQEVLRVLIAEVLHDAGYRVLTAEDGPGALEALQGAGRVDLLLTDVGLPGGLNGRQVADCARVHRPALKVLFITGYAESAGVGSGQLDEGMQILTKPFELDTLTQRVRDSIG